MECNGSLSNLDSTDGRKLEGMPANARKYFLGSSIGNFYPGEDIKFLKNLSKCIDRKSYIFIGVDLVKKASIINKAYNDKAGYTAKFSLNLINIINTISLIFG